MMAQKKLQLCICLFYWVLILSHIIEKNDESIAIVLKKLQVGLLWESHKDSRKDLIIYAKDSR